MKQLYSVKNNWDVFKPHLNDKNVVDELAFALGYGDSSYWNQDEDAPWTHTRTDYWVCEIDERIDADENFQSELTVALNGVDEDDDKWIEIYEEVREKYSPIHEPKRGEYDWYQWKHACHDMAPVMAEMVRASLPGAHRIRVVTSRSHSVVQFEMDEHIYYVDILNEWDTVDALEDFMENGKVFGERGDLS